MFDNSKESKEIHACTVHQNGDLIELVVCLMVNGELCVMFITARMLHLFIIVMFTQQVLVQATRNVTQIVIDLFFLLDTCKQN